MTNMETAYAAKELFNKAFKSNLIGQDQKIIM